MIVNNHQDFGIIVDSLNSQCDTPRQSLLLKADIQLEIHMGYFDFV